MAIPTARTTCTRRSQPRASRFLLLPVPVDLFQNSIPLPDGRLDVYASINPPGGYVTLRAEQDLLLVVAACSVDYDPTIGGICTEIEVQITRPE